MIQDHARTRTTRRRDEVSGKRMKNFRVALLYSLSANAPQEATDEDTPWDRWNELDSEKSVAGYERALREAGHDVIPLEGDHKLIDNLLKYKPDICFNTCEGHYGKSREAQVPAILDMLRIPYTGSGVMSLSIALDKAMTKRVLQFYSIPTPAFQEFVTGDEPTDPRLNYPLFAKPSLEGSGIGIMAKSICRTPRELRDQVRFLLRAYKQPVLVEEYIQGREVTTGILGNLIPRGAWIKEKSALKRNGRCKRMRLRRGLNLWPRTGMARMGKSHPCASISFRGCECCRRWKLIFRDSKMWRRCMGQKSSTITRGDQSMCVPRRCLPS